MMNKKNVVLIRSNPVCPYPRLEKTANTLIKNGYGVHVLAWDRNENYSARDETLSLPDGQAIITRVGLKGEFSGGMRKNLISLIKFQIFIYKWLKQHQSEYDIIHAYDFDTGYMARKCAKRYKKKFIYDIADYYVDSHNLNGTRLGEVIKHKENDVIDYAEAVIICSEKRKEQIKGASPQKLIIIHNTPYKNQADIETSEIGKFGDRALKIAYVGVFGKTRFLDSIAETVAARSDCELHIGGYGSNMEKFFEKMCEEYANIHYYGRTSYNQTLYIEKMCDVICAIYDPSIPNHKYAAPNKFYEALMLGKPIIMAKDTGMDDLVRKNDIGEVISYDKEALDKALTKLIDRKEDWESMSIRARKLYDEYYSWDIMEKRLVNLYNSL